MSAKLIVALLYKRMKQRWAPWRAAVSFLSGSIYGYEEKAGLKEQAALPLSIRLKNHPRFDPKEEKQSGSRRK